MDITPNDWKRLAPLSGEALGRELGIDGGSARRIIRAAKDDPDMQKYYRYLCTCS